MFYKHGFNYEKSRENDPFEPTLSENNNFID